MRTFILTEGGKNSGFGHIARCLAICQGFNEKDISCEMVVNGDDTINDILDGAHYTVFDWLDEKDKVLATIEDADIVIVDSYLADESFYKDIVKRAKKVVYVDDNNRIEYPKGIVLNGNIYANGLDYMRNENIAYLLGSRYTPLRKAFWDVPEKAIASKVESILLTTGGKEQSDVTLNILKMLVERFPDIEKKVVVSKAFDVEKGMDKTEFIYGTDERDILNIMLDSDIATSAGGQTLNELARVGVPAIGICFADNQRQNLAAWQEKGFIEHIGRHDDADLLEKLSKTINDLSFREKRERMSNAGRSEVNGQGAREIVTEVLKTVCV
ncbi:MAG: UDP-2,4-diacetamido-2,4,6-trideoxy-beta-L-altropyranose hydrolase [Candidatus Omnitrophica bacterium]|nr:UDP-2,4-diacetamido-2,4,6-trideoxy-beta-L-altropyranose hydrolase [Candidatus Omnitrophota bacterium]